MLHDQRIDFASAQAMGGLESLMSAFDRSREPDNLHALERAPPRSRSTAVILAFPTARVRKGRRGKISGFADRAYLRPITQLLKSTPASCMFGRPQNTSTGADKQFANNRNTCDQWYATSRIVSIELDPHAGRRDNPFKSCHRHSINSAAVTAVFIAHGAIITIEGSDEHD